MKSVSVVIPAYNEEKTIGQVIDIVNNSNVDCEVIVINNCCTDDTTKIATEKGAKVVYCEQKGKGYAMEAGLKAAQNETLQYTEDPIVSSDVIGRRCGSLVDGLSTTVLDVDGKQLVKVVSWYDNEMSYTAQMVRTAKYLMK